MSFPESGIRAVVENLNGFMSDVGKMDKAIQSIGSDTSAIRNWNDSITTVVGNVGKIVGTMAVGATAAIGGFIADSVLKSKDLEQAVADIGAVWGKMGSDLDPIRDKIQSLGLDPNLKVSSTEASQAIEALARNGVTMEEVINGAADATILLSNATGGDFGNSANIASDAMAQFNIKAEDMDKVINGIVGTTVNSKLTIDGYGLAIGQAGGIAGSFGVSLEDLNTTLAATISRFNGGSDAGTGFKTFLQRLIPVSGPATDAMRDLGLFTGLTKDEFESAQDKIVKYKDQLADLDPTSKNYAKRSEELNEKIQVLQSSLVSGKNAFFDNNGAMKDMDEIAGILQQATAGLSEEQKNAALSTIFGTDAIRTALGLADMGQEKYNELAKSIHGVDAAQMAAARNDTFQGSLEILGGIIETLQQSIGKRFEPALRSITDWASDFLSRNSERIVNFFGQFADGLKTAADRLIPVVESWLPKLEEKMDDGSFSIEGMIDKVGDIIKGVKDFTDKIIGVVKPVADWITENYTLEEILNGILAVVTVSLIPAITSLISTVTPVIALFTTVAELTRGLGDDHGNLALAIGVAVFAIPPLVTAIGTIVTAITSVVGFITGAAGIVPALGAILNPVGLVVAAIAGLALAWTTDFGGIQTITKEILSDVGDKISSWSSSAVESFKEFQKNVGETLATWSENIGTTFATWSDNIGTTLSGWASKSVEWFDKFKTDASDKISSWSSSAKTKFDDFSSNASETMRTFKDKAIERTNELVDKSLTEYSNLFSKGSKHFEDLATSIRDATDGSKNEVVSKFGELASGSLLKFSDLLDKGSATFGKIRDFMRKASSDADFDVRDTFRIMVSSSLEAFGDLASKGGQKFLDLKDRVIDKIKDLVTDGVDRFKRFVSDALEVFNVQKWIQAGADLIGGLLKGLRDAVTAPLRWVTDFAGNLVGAFKDALGIRSPSTVFDEFGVNIMEGLEGGLEARSSGVLSFMSTFSDALVATTAEAQRQADKNFAALTESATAAYNGYVVIAGDMAKLSQAIDQNAIAAAEAARKAAEAAKQAEKDKAAAEVAAVDKYFGFGRVSELIDQIKGIVNAAFEVNGTAVRSLGIDLSNLTTSGATNDAIARLQLLAGTIQQNAGAATNVDDRNRLSSLYSDLTGRILPLLKAQANTLKAEEDKAKADAQAAATPATLTALNQAIKDLNSYVETLRTQGIAAYAGPIKDMYGNSLLTPELQAVFDQVNQNVMTAASALYGDVRNLAFKGTTLGAEGLAGSFGNFQRVLDFVANVTDALKGTSFGWLDTSVETGSQNLFSSLASSFVQALPALGGNTSNLTVNTGDINNGMDLATLQALIQQAVAEALP